MADPRLVAVGGWLIGFGPFAAAGMLLWGVVAAIPILLHLLRRRRSRVVRWGAMQFVRAAIARRAKEFQLWRLLLLCLRVAAVFFLAVALARPLLPGGAGNATGAIGRRTPGTLRVFVIDASYSMRAVADGRSRFEVAQAAAADMARRAPAGDGFLLLKMSDVPEPIIQTVSYRPDETIAQIEALQPGEGSAGLPSALAAVETAVDDAVRAGWGGPVDVIWLSDLQEVTWLQKEGLQKEGLQKAAVRQEPKRLPGDGQIMRHRVVDVATRPVKDNATVVRLERDAPSRAADESQQFMATISHTAGDPIQGRLAQLVVDGNIVQSQRFDLQPGDSRALVWSTRLERGRHAVELRIGEDALATDNVAGIVVDIAPTVSIAAFGHSPDATRYVALAAAPVGNAATEVRTFEMNQLPRTEIGRFDLWILCDPLPLQSEAERRVAQHLRQGGGVLWWLGPRWQEGRGGITGGSSTASPTTAWNAVEIATAGEAAVDPLDYRSAIVQPFEAFPGAGLLSLPVFRYWVLELGRGWMPALALGGDPLIATLASDGEGRQILIATPPGPGIASSEQAGESGAAEPWNALIAWPAFVPLVQEMIHWARADATRRTVFLVGEPVTGRTPEEEMGERLISAEGNILDVEVRSRGGRSVQWDAGPATAAGVYRWTGAAGGTGGSGEDRLAGPPAVVVTVDPQEGRLAKVDQLPERFTRFTAESPVEESMAEDAIGAKEAERDELASDAEGREIYWWVLWAAAGLLVAESVIVRMLEGRF